MRASNRLWRLVSKQRRVPSRGLSSLVDEFGSEYDLLDSLTDQLRNHFSCEQSTRTCTLTSEIDSSLTTADEGWCPEFFEYQVLKQLRRYSNKKASGADGIPTRIYVVLADLIAKPLSIKYKESCLQKKVPDLWKRGIIVPVADPHSRAKACATLRPTKIAPNTEKT